ncbi:arginyltransferase [Pelagibius sp. CAU 1746]|uniref:arginyltransferase n=1 Tax=Pelagibius sp. CAU 1746 TaxID=3140370 RepID=UPI00325A5157
MDPTAFGPLQSYYVLEPNVCPYLPSRLENKLLTKISGPQAQAAYDTLSLAGFRRSHRYAYRPACSHCNACVPVRVVAGEFEPGKSLRRIARANGDLSVHMGPACATEEQFNLFRRYISSRHGDGEMAGMSEEEYRSMVESSDIDTRLAEFRRPDGTLIAVCLLDWLADGPSAVYSFFDPASVRRSLGTFVVLWLIDAALHHNAPHVYLGYWIDHSRKMAYKTRFQPLEAFGTEGWRRLPA